MRHLILVFFFIFQSCLYADSDHYNKQKEPAKSFHEARKLLKEGKFEEAHKIHQWMFNNIEECRPETFSLTVTNLTYDWHKVAVNHPPAMKTLLERRDSSMKWLLEKGEDLEKSYSGEMIDGKLTLVKDLNHLKQKIYFSEVISINRWLKRGDLTVTFFEELERKLPKFTKSVYLYAEDDLYEAKALKIAGKYQMEAGTSIEVAQMGYKISKEAQGGRFAEKAKRDFEDHVEQYIKIQMANGEKEQAKKARDLSLGVVDSDRIKSLDVGD